MLNAESTRASLVSGLYRCINDLPLVDFYKRAFHPCAPFVTAFEDSSHTRNINFFVVLIIFLLSFLVIYVLFFYSFLKKNNEEGNIFPEAFPWKILFFSFFSNSNAELFSSVVSQVGYLLFLSFFLFWDRECFIFRCRSSSHGISDFVACSSMLEYRNNNQFSWN